MPKLYGFNDVDVGRIRDTVRDRESGPGRRPLGQSPSPKVAPARVVIWELVSETPDGDGYFDVYIKRRLPDGTWENVSMIKAKLENLNA